MNSFLRQRQRRKVRFARGVDQHRRLTVIVSARRVSRQPCRWAWRRGATPIGMVCPTIEPIRSLRVVGFDRRHVQSDSRLCPCPRRHGARQRTVGRVGLAQTRTPGTLAQLPDGLLTTRSVARSRSGGQASAWNSLRQTRVEVGEGDTMKTMRALGQDPLGDLNYEKATFNVFL